MSGETKPYLTNPDYKNTNGGIKTGPATWWRTATFFTKYIFAEDGWNKFWRSEEGFKADEKYAPKVTAAYAAYAKDPSSQNYNAIAALLEDWLDGTIRGKAKAHTVENYTKGSRYIFEADMVRLSGETKPYLTNPDYKNTKKQILVIGDSLSDGGWEENKDAVWSRLLPARLIKEGYSDYEMNEQAKAGICTRTVNGKIGAKERLADALAVNPYPAIVVIGIGVNNYSRGISLADTEADIKWMVEKAQKTGAKVLLLGMYLPPGLRVPGKDLTKIDRDWLEANGISGTGGDAWSKGLQKINEKIARKNAGDKSFAYLPNYWDPIDGDDNQLSPDELQGDKDKTHPALRDQQALFEHVWKSLDALKSGKQIIVEPIPELNIKFKGSKRKAGENPTLTFELAEEISAGAKFDLKYWVKINDKDAGAANGTIPKAGGYVNYDKYFVRYDEKDPWKPFAYSSKSQLVATKNTSKIYLKFETFNKAPYSFDLMVNLGGKSYSVFVEDGSKLYIKDSKTESARHASDVRQHQDSNTCYLLAALQAATSRKESNDYLATLITEDSQNFYVKFKDYEQLTITKKEVTTELWNIEAAGRGSRYEELWVRVLELAYLRATKSKIDQDGSPSKALKMFTGKEASEINGSEAAIEAVTQLLNTKNPHHIVVGTKQKLGGDMKEFRENHAYAVTSIKNDKFILWDPIGGASKEVTKDQLSKISERFFITDLKNGDVSTKPFPELIKPEVGAEPAPDVYARFTLLAEHKIKSDPKDNKYQNWIQSDEDGPLRKVEEFYADYKRKVQDWNDPDNYKNLSNYEGNLFTRMTQINKAGDDAPDNIPKGVMYFKFENWRKYKEPGQTAWSFKKETETYAKQGKQIRVSKSDELTVGGEFRTYTDVEENFEEEMKRSRLGFVAGFTRNFETMTTWTKNGELATGNSLRLRRRFSVAFEAIAYATVAKGDGGLLMGLRFKVQLQVGRINEGKSWWFTLGAEVSSAFDFSTLESSMASLIDAIVKDDRARAETYYEDVLNKAASANIYVGMNGLWQDGTKKLMEKIALKNDRESVEQDVRTWKNADATSTINAEIIKNHLDEARANYRPMGKILLRFGDFFHNLKWKVEVGALWLPWTWNARNLQGDGKYAGTPAKSFDTLYNDFQQIYNWQANFENILNKGSTDEIRKLIPANILTMVDAIGTSKSFGDAIHEQIAKADEAASNDMANGRYRSFLSEMTAPAKTVVMAGLMDTITERIMNKITDATETIGNGGTSNFRLPKMLTDTQVESAEDYGKYLATLAPGLVGDALKSIFSSKAAMLSMLLYAAIFVTESALNKFMEELERKNSGGDSDLSDEDKKSVRQKVRAEDYKRFGIDAEMAKDLGDGVSVEDVKKKYKLSATEASNLDKKLEQHSVAKSMRSGGIDPNAANSLAKNRGFNFDDVAKDMGWSEDQKNNIREKLENVAKQNNASIYSLIANNAFKSGMTPDQSLAYDILKGNPQIPRNVLRNIVLDPKKFDSLTKGLPDSALEDLRSRINAAPGAKENSVLKDMAKYAKAKDWLSGLTEEQRTIATRIFDKINATGVMSTEDAQTISRKLTVDGKLDQLSGPQLDTSININSMNAIAFGKATNNIASDKLKDGASSRVDLLLGFVPLILALGSNNPREKANALGELVSGAALAGIALALGPIGIAFEVIALAIMFSEKPLNKAVAKNPLLLLIPAVAFSWGFNKAFSNLKAVFSTVFMEMIQNVGRTGKSVKFEPLSKDAAIFQSYAPYYNQEQFRAYSAATGSEEDRLELGKQAATSALLLEMLADGVITADSFVKAISETTFNEKNLEYDLSKIPAAKLATGIAYALLSTSFDIFDYWINEYGDYKESSLEGYTNRAIFAGLLNRLGDNQSDIVGDHVRFWATYGHETGPDIFTIDKSGFKFNATSGGYAFVGEGQNVRNPENLYDTGTRMKPSTRLIERLTYLAELGMLRYVNKTKSDGSVVQVLNFGNHLDARDAPVTEQSALANSRRWGMMHGIWYYASHHVEDGDTNSLSFLELAVAINNMRPNGAPAIDWRALECAVRLRLDLGSEKHLTWDQLEDLIWHQGNGQGSILEYIDVWGWRNNTWQSLGTGMDRNFELDKYNSYQMTKAILETFGNKDAKDISDVWLGEALWKMGAIEAQANNGFSEVSHSQGDDAKDFAKFLTRGYDKDIYFGKITRDIIWSMFQDGTISLTKNSLSIDFGKMGAERIARAFFGLASKDDDHLSAREFIQVLNYLEPKKRYNENDTRLQKSYEQFMESTGFSGSNGGRHFTEASLKGAINDGWLNSYLKTRMPNVETIFYRGKPLSPVVLDLSGDGLRFESLATSAALYDSNTDGKKESVAWTGTGTGILAYDLDGDKLIDRTNEIAFTSYKPGAKTDLEGLTAFDSNKNGKLDAGDKDWKKFVVWLDRNGDGSSDAGEVVTLDKVGIANINLTSDKKTQRLDGVTLHGTTTFTTTDGRKGTVGDVSFDVSKSSLSAAEIARRRDLLAQAVATSATTKSASTGLRASGADLAINLNLFASKT